MRRGELAIYNSLAPSCGASSRLACLSTLCGVGSQDEAECEAGGFVPSSCIHFIDERAGGRSLVGLTTTLAVLALCDHPSRRAKTLRGERGHVVRGRKGREMAVDQTDTLDIAHGVIKQ